MSDVASAGPAIEYGERLDDECCAPESGEIIGAREDPWEGETESPTHPWPSPHHASPKDEL